MKGDDGVVHGVVAVICSDGRILSILRPADIVLGGRWCFPGGAVEPGESQAEAVVREVREEVGLDIEAGRKVWEWFRPGGGLVLHWWSTRLVDADQPVRLNPREADEHIWATPDELRSLERILESDIEFLDLVEGNAIEVEGLSPEADTDADSTSKPARGEMTRREFMAGGAAGAAGIVLARGESGRAGQRTVAESGRKPESGRSSTMPVESTLGVIQTRPSSLKLSDWHDEDPKRYESHNQRLNIRGKGFDRTFFEHVETRYIGYVCGLLRKAGKQGIDLVMLPEAMLVVSRNVSLKRREQFIELSRWSNKAWFDAIRPIAKKHRMIIASCLYQADDQDRLSNDGVLTDENGDNIGTYHKVHLPGWHDDPNTEVTNFVAGDSFPVFKTRIGKVGFQICYDIDFPEGSSCLALNGADCILHPTVGYNFPDEEEQVAEARLRTRATDNHVVVACAMPGTGPVREGGCSAIVDQCGSVVATAGKRREAVIQARVTLGAPRIRYWGKLKSNARDTLRRKRRPDTYGILVDKRPPGFPKGKHRWGRDYLYDPKVGLP